MQSRIRNAWGKLIVQCFNGYDDYHRQDNYDDDGDDDDGDADEEDGDDDDAHRHDNYEE